MAIQNCNAAVQSAATEQLIAKLAKKYSILRTQLNSTIGPEKDEVLLRICENALRRRKEIDLASDSKQSNHHISHENCEVRRHGSGFEMYFTTSCDILLDESWLASFGPSGYRGFQPAPCIVASVREMATNWSPVPNTDLLQSMHRRGSGVKRRFRKLLSQLPYQSHELAILLTEGWSRTWAIMLARLAHVAPELAGAVGACVLQLAGAEGSTGTGDDAWWEVFVDGDAAAIETAYALSLCDQLSIHAYCFTSNVVAVPPRNSINDDTTALPQSDGCCSIEISRPSQSTPPRDDQVTFSCHRDLRWVDAGSYSQIRASEAVGSPSESCRYASVYGTFVNDFADACDDFTNYNVSAFKDLWPSEKNVLWKFAAHTNWLLSDLCELSKDPFFKLSVCFAWFVHIFNPRYALVEVYESMRRRYPGFGYCCYALVPGYLFPTEWTFESPIVKDPGAPTVDIDLGRRLYFSAIAAERVNTGGALTKQSLSFLEWCDIAIVGGWGPQPYAIWANYALCTSKGIPVGNCPGCGRKIAPGYGRLETKL